MAATTSTFAQSAEDDNALGLKRISNGDQAGSG